MLKPFFILIACVCVANLSIAQVSDENITASIKEYDLANVAMMKKQDAEAYTHLKDAVKLDPTNSTFINSAAYMAMHMGELETSLDYLKRSLALDTEKFGETHPNVASILNNMGSVYSKMGESEKAVDYYNQAYAIISKVLGEKHPQAVNVKRIRDEEVAKIN